MQAPTTVARPSPRRLAPMAVLVLLLGSVAIACGDGAPGDAEGSPPAATPVPLGDIPAGTYSFDIAGRTLSFTLGAGWSHYGAGVGGRSLELQFGDTEEPPDLEAITVFTASTGPEESLEDLGGFEGIEILDQAEGSVAGLPGTRVSLSVGRDAEDPTVLLHYEGGGGQYYLAPGNRAEIWVLDLEGTALVVAVEGPEEGFDEFLPTAEAVVTSMRI